MKRWDPRYKRWIEINPPVPYSGPNATASGIPASPLGITGMTRQSGDVAYDPAYQSMMNKFQSTLSNTKGSVEKQKQAMSMADALGKSVLNSALTAGEFQSQNALRTIQSVLASAGLKGRNQPSLARAGGSPGTLPDPLGFGMQLPGASPVAVTGGIGAMRPLTGETSNPLFPMTSREPQQGGLTSPQGNYLGGISNMAHASLPPSANLQNRMVITRQPTEDRPGYYNMIAQGATVPESRRSSMLGINLHGNILTPEDYMHAAAEKIAKPPGKNKNETKKALHWDPMLKEWVNY